jgi:predicted DNA-binding transcriptional regulator YafY
MEIERRLETVLRLVQSGRYSTPLLAVELGVSIPTVSRDVTALRERGYDIRAERQSDGTWKFGLARRANRSRPKINALAEARP